MIHAFIYHSRFIFPFSTLVYTVNGCTTRFQFPHKNPMVKHNTLLNQMSYLLPNQTSYLVSNQMSSLLPIITRKTLSIFTLSVPNRIANYLVRSSAFSFSLLTTYNHISFSRWHTSLLCTLVCVLTPIVGLLHDNPTHRTRTGTYMDSLFTHNSIYSFARAHFGSAAHAPLNFIHLLIFSFGVLIPIIQPCVIIDQ